MIFLWCKALSKNDHLKPRKDSLKLLPPQVIPNLQFFLFLKTPLQVIPNFIFFSKKSMIPIEYLQNFDMDHLKYIMKFEQLVKGRIYEE